MTTKIDPVSTIVESFPIPELNRVGEINQSPTYASLLTVQKQLNTNSASVDSTQGTGIHGHLVLTMSPTDFGEMTTIGEAAPIPHPPPVNPGMLPPLSTEAIARTHAEALYHFKTYQSTDKALKKLLIAACPDMYLRTLSHKTAGYANVTTLQMLTHLWSVYGKIKPEDLDTNLITIATPWHPSSPIETLFLQIDDGINFSIAGESPIDDKTAVRIIYKIIFDTGVFALPCRDWRSLPDAEKTLDNFKIFFNDANNDRDVTTSAVGYHGAAANSAVTINDTLASLLAAHNKLLKQVEKLTNQTPASTSNVSATVVAPPKYEDYCSTHGTTHAYKESSRHNSINCRNPGPNHNLSATADNKMGGSEKVWKAATPKST
jgi:hypothetical protein